MRTSTGLAVNVERDSICAGDDIDAPHAMRFAFQLTDTLEQALSTIVDAYLPNNIAGGKATWIVEAAGKSVAVVAQQWESPQFLIKPTTQLIECVVPEAPKGLFFRYWCQVSPVVVFDCLRLGRPLPDIYGRDE